MQQVFRTKITEMLGIDHPILCGGMQWISRAEFVAAICNAGAFGFITAESFETAASFRDEIRKMRDLTDRPFGVNLSMLPEFKVAERTTAFCDVVCEEGILAVETAGRNPEPLMPRLKEAGVKVIHKVTSLRHAEKAQAAGVDAVTLIGFEAGGHVGMDDVASFILIPLAASRLQVPVVAGGSICNGRGLLGALAMGAEAVLMGTRFLATPECPIHPAVKERVVRTGEKDTALVMRSIFNPMRCLRNRLAEEVLAMEERGTTLEEILLKVAGGKGKQAYEIGDPEMSPIPCGQIAGLIDAIQSVKEVIDSMVAEAEELRGRLNRMVSCQDREGSGDFRADVVGTGS
jgi:NAD(P)H-dependent flavin oxidoreductase YrpB (nitropropane dioxygenase family)